MDFDHWLNNNTEELPIIKPKIIKQGIIRGILSVHEWKKYKFTALSKKIILKILQYEKRTQLSVL